MVIACCVVCDGLGCHSRCEFFSVKFVEREPVSCLCAIFKSADIDNFSGACHQLNVDTGLHAFIPHIFIGVGDAFHISRWNNVVAQYESKGCYYRGTDHVRAKQTPETHTA